MLPLPERTPEELDAALQNRMEMLVSDLMVIDGMTQRGARLEPLYRQLGMPAVRRMAERVLEALEKGETAKQPWDHAA